MKELIKIDDTTFFVGGESLVIERQTKSIVVDGEVYTNSKPVEVLVNLKDKFFKDMPHKKKNIFWSKVVTNFMSIFGKNEVSIYYPDFIYYDSPFYHSQNIQVDLYVEYLQKFGVKYLELKPIKYESNRVMTGKLYSDSNPLQSIDITLLGYGFNNFLTIEVALQDFFEKDLYLNSYHYKTEDFLKKLSTTFRKHLESNKKDSKILEADKIKILSELITNRQYATSKY